MNCPNCNKSYHWCGSCGWDAGLYACSYECARDLWDDDKLDDSGMLEWALEEIDRLNTENTKIKRDLKSRSARTVKSVSQDPKLVEYKEKRKSAIENQGTISQEEGETQLRKYDPSKQRK
jgi:hypothetical protein